MGQVTVTIADKVYRIACDEGQETHLERLALDLDARIARMRDSFGEIGGNRLTVMAAIAALDQRQEALERIAALEAEAEHLRAHIGALEARFSRAETEIATAVIEAARRIETVADDIVPALRL